MNEHRADLSITVFSHPKDSILDRLGVIHNTDKSSANRKRKSDSDASRPPGHNYLVKYELFLEKFRTDSIVRLLELGAGPDWNIGASAKVWSDYFPRLELHIADIKESASALRANNIHVHVGDLGDAGFLGLLNAHGMYDIIIDDASHLWSHQIDCFVELFSSLRPGGLYILEDILTSFGRMRDRYHGGSSDDAFLMLSHLSALIAGKGRPHPSLSASPIEPDLASKLQRIFRDVDMLSFVNYSCILVKSA
jgi:hypothetical protein